MPRRAQRLTAPPDWSAAWGLGLYCLALGSCGDRATGVADEQPGESRPPPAQADAADRVAIPGPEADAAEWKKAVTGDAEGLFAAIMGVADKDKRYSLACAFFYYLAEIDPMRAVQLMPEPLSADEQSSWAIPVVEGLGKEKRFGDLVRFIDSRFKGSIRRDAYLAATGRLAGDRYTADDVMAFWDVLGDSQTRDQFTGEIAAALGKKAPERAVQWFDSLGSDAREGAARRLAGETQEAIARQLALATDQGLRKALAAAFGDRYRRGDIDPAVAAAEIAGLPPDLVADAEVAYIKRLASEAAGGEPDLESIQAYLLIAHSEEGRDAAFAAIAQIEIERNPGSYSKLLLESGLSNHDLDLWKRSVQSWSRRDREAAAAFVAALPDGAAKTAATDAAAHAADIEARNAERAAREQEAATPVSRDALRLRFGSEADVQKRLELGRWFGWALRREGAVMEEAIAELAALPPDVAAEAERAYVTALGHNLGDLSADLDAVERYASDGLTAHGRNAATFILAEQTVRADARKGMILLVESGMSEIDPDRFAMNLWIWLEVDSQAASAFVAEIPDGAGRRAAVGTLVNYLDRRGDQEAAAAWREELER